jgi:hypothetical protein
VHGIIRPAIPLAAGGCRLRRPNTAPARHPDQEDESPRADLRRSTKHHCPAVTTPDRRELPRRNPRGVDGNAMPEPPRPATSSKSSSNARRSRR